MRPHLYLISINFSSRFDYAPPPPPSPTLHPSPVSHSHSSNLGEQVQSEAQFPDTFSWGEGEGFAILLKP